jgi:p21-activated kinase 1
MKFSSRDETRDSNTPWCSSSRASVNGGVRRIFSNETISNSSVHTMSTTDAHKDLSDPSGQFPPHAVSRNSSESSAGQYPSISHIKSFNSLGKPTCLSRNQSLSTIHTNREPNSDGESDYSGSTAPPTPKQEPSPFFPALEDEAAEISLPPTSQSPQAAVPTRAKAPSLGLTPTPSPVFTTPPPSNGPLMKSYSDSPLLATAEISTPNTPATGPTSFPPPSTDRTGTRSRARSSSTATTNKEKKGILGFMNGLRKSVDFRDSNKRLEVSAPFDLVHVQRVDIDPITGELNVSPGKLHDFFLDKRVSEHDREMDSPATMEVSPGNDWETMRYDALNVPRPPLPRIPSMTTAADPEVSEPVDDSLTSPGWRVPRFPRPLSDHLKFRTLPLPKKGHARAHSSSVSQVAYTTHSPASYRFPPRPTARPNLDLSCFQQAQPKPPPRNDPPARGNASGDRRSPELQPSVKTTPTTSPVTERRSSPTTASQRRSGGATSLAKSAGATPRRREKKKGNKANDAELMKRLQEICRDADPTQSYDNLVKIGQG